VQESDELFPENIISDDGITTRTQFVKMQHDDHALSKLFALDKAGNQDKSSTFERFVMTFLSRRRNRISPVCLAITQVVEPSAL